MIAIYNAYCEYTLLHKFEFYRDDVLNYVHHLSFRRKAVTDIEFVGGGTARVQKHYQENDDHFNFLRKTLLNDEKIRLFRKSHNSGSIGDVKNEVVSPGVAGLIPSGQIVYYLNWCQHEGNE